MADPSDITNPQESALPYGKYDLPMDTSDDLKIRLKLLRDDLEMRHEARSVLMSMVVEFDSRLLVETGTHAIALGISILYPHVTMDDTIAVVKRCWETWNAETIADTETEANDGSKQEPADQTNSG